MYPASGVPRLVVFDGPDPRASWDIPFGETTIGRDSPAGLARDDTVSRRHASVSRHGDQVLLRDLNSTNGTWVNDDPLHGSPRVLHPGDTVRMGRVQLSFVASPAERPMRFGDVHGPVNAGPGNQYVAGRDQHVAGRDQNFHHTSYTNDYDPSDEMFQGKGVGRVLLIFGTLVALGGFAMIMYFILDVGAGIDDPFGQNPFAAEIAPGVPLLPVAFGLFLLGGILAGVGTGMSKAARKRAERRDHR
jgi:hypothetical protein